MESRANVGQGATKKRKTREFLETWLDDDNLKGWLAPHPTENKSYCNVCKKTIRCAKTDLVQHSQTDKHIENIRSQSAILNKNNSTNNSTKSLSHKDKIKSAEIKLAAFFAEHNVAFNTVDHLTPLLKNIFLDSKIAQDLSLGREKCKNIVTNIIARRESEKLVTNLQTCRFSILIDESTDINDEKILCISIQFVCPIDKKIHTQLLELISMNAADCSANKIYETFKKVLESKNIPLQNIVGMACDNASVMIGCNNSFMSRLKLEVPYLVTLNCICHSSALVASKACEKLPQTCENLIRNVSSFVSGSAKRCAILSEIQEFCNMERNKILKLCNTRWLILHKCIVRLLENWDVLKHFFIFCVVEEKSKSAEVILIIFNNVSIKAYFLFLKYSLQFFNMFNALFQSRKILIHQLFEKSRILIYQIAQNCIISHALKDISLLNIDDKNNIKNITEIYVGPECECFLSELPLENVTEIKLKCLDFYITAIREMLSRLPYNNELFKQLTFLDPKIALYEEGRNKIKDLTFLATRLGYTNITQLAFEWRMLPSVYTEEKKQKLASLEIDEMWKEILEYTDFENNKMFHNLEIIVQIVLSFPHSNAEAERIFSIVTDVRCKKRNRLSNDTVSAICITRSSFQTKGLNCINFEVDSNHLALHNYSNLYIQRCNSDRPPK